jgi:hypothetical protein
MICLQSVRRPRSWERPPANVSSPRGVGLLRLSAKKNAGNPAPGLFGSAGDDNVFPVRDLTIRRLT